MAILPSVIVINNTPYTISLHPTLIETDPAQRTQCYGNVDFRDNCIRLWAGHSSFPALMRTLLHEIVHALLKEYNVETVACVEENYERDVENLAVALYALFKDNEVLFNALEDAIEVSNQMANEGIEITYEKVEG